MHKASIVLTDVCISRKWIAEDRKEWCIYAIETKMQAILLFSLISILSYVLDVWLEALIYSWALYILRRKIGGWHAPTVWLCQVISILLVLSAILFIGPFFQKLSFPVIWILDGFAFLIALLQKPVYPAQTHFSNEITLANHHRKNLFLAVIILAQVLTTWFLPEVTIYSMLAIYTGILSIFIENHRQHAQRKERLL